MINSIVEFSPDLHFQFICVTSNPNIELGKFYQHPKFLNVEYLAVTRLSKTSQKKKLALPHSLLYSIGLIRFRSKLRPEVVHTHRLEVGAISLMLWPKILLKQFIHNSANNLTSSNSDSYWKYFSHLYKKIEFNVLQRSSLILVFNNSEFNRISLLYKNVVRGYTWFDSTTYNFSPVEKTPDTPIRIIWVGRLERQKNPELIIDVARELKNAGFVFVIEVFGSGSLKNQIKEIIDKSEMNHLIKLCGVVSANTLASKYKQADTLLATSRYEGSPTMLIEAMACGLPILCTAESDPDSIVLNGVTGYTFEASNLASIVDNLPNVLKLSRVKISRLTLGRSRQEILTGRRKKLGEVE